MNKVTYVGLDVHKDTIAVAVADEGRQGEIRFFGTIPNTADSVLRLTKRLTEGGKVPTFCYRYLRVGKSRRELRLPARLEMRLRPISTQQTYFRLFARLFLRGQGRYTEMSTVHLDKLRMRLKSQKLSK